MHAVGNRNNLPVPVIDKFYRFQCLHGKPWKNDVDDYVLLINADHLEADGTQHILAVQKVFWEIVLQANQIHIQPHFFSSSYQISDHDS